MAPPHVHTQELLAKGRISLALDTYDDIFSDFDPRPYAERALSDDFLVEAKRAAIDKGDCIELRFTLPTKLRNPELETVIIARLRKHFERHGILARSEQHVAVRNGLLITCLGFGIIITAATIHGDETFFERLLTTILEPSGWFTMWYGLDTVFYTAREKEPERTFYRKMMHAEIVFEGY